MHTWAMLYIPLRTVERGAHGFLDGLAVAVKYAQPKVGQFYEGCGGRYGGQEEILRFYIAVQHAHLKGGGGRGGSHARAGSGVRIPRDQDSDRRAAETRSPPSIRPCACIGHRALYM